MKFDWARIHVHGYEVSSAGDRRFSALYAQLADGRTIEEAYQLDVKGYRRYGNNWRLGKGKKSLRDVDTWAEYLALWRQWAAENPPLIAELRWLADAHYKTRTHRQVCVDTSEPSACIGADTFGLR